MRQFPFVKQLDAMQCGIACMAMICRHYGRDYSAETLNRHCTPTTEGVSLKGLSDLAHDIGMECVASKVAIDYLPECPLPAILHWNQNHFVVLYKVSRNRKHFHIADPGKGKIRYSRDEFGKLIETHSGERRSMRFLMGYIRQYRKYFAQIILGLLLGCILQLIMPFLTQSIVDIGIKNGDIGFIWLVLLGEVFIVAGRTATDFIRRWLLLHISMRINISLVSDFFIKLLKLPMAFFDTKLLGDIMQRMGDHNRVQSFLTNQVLSIVFSFLGFIIFGIVLFIYNKVIFGVFLLGSIIYGIWISTFLQKRKVLDYELFEQQAKNNNKTYQFISCMQEIKLQDCEQRRRWEWEDIQADLFTVQMKSLKLQQTQEAGSIFINEIKNIIITVLSATAVIEGQMTLGAMLAVQYIIGQLNAPIEQLMSFIYSLQDVKISLERINEIHQNRNEESDTHKATAFTDSDKSIILSDISFKYDRHALRRTIDGVSAVIPGGKVTAIVGASGSGKTTLIKLMLGYYQVEEGKITIASQSITDYNLRWWRRQCGVVMQDGVIFSESIARNIAVSDGTIGTSRLEHAARIANIHDYVMSLPLKYETVIGRDGVGLSQGQRQRILIARAVYKNPDFIFLDEATNALDAENERTIVENLADFYHGRTVVVVAHRLSTVKDADQIIVLNGGKVVETGTHDSLCRKKGTYFNLVKNQLELGN